MSDLIVKYCKYCAGPLKMRYPGAGQQADGTWNDGFDCAENGPASMRCRIASHGGPVDWDEEAVSKAEGWLVDDFLQKLACGQIDYAEAAAIPVNIEAAAKQILDWQELVEAEEEAQYHLQEAEFDSEIPDSLLAHTAQADDSKEWQCLDRNCPDAKSLGFYHSHQGPQKIGESDES